MPLRALSTLPALLVALASIAATGCASLARDSPREVAPGASEPVALGVADLGFGRTYRLHRPPDFDTSSAPAPLVVALHGGLATARIFEQQTGLSQLADEKGFLVAYPNGVGIFNLLRHWNAAWCCAKAKKAGIDDVARITQVIEQIAAHWPVDRQRIYLVGYSNGGMLAHLFAARYPEQLAGLAVFAGPADLYRPSNEDPLRPQGDLPTLLIHGTADRRLPVRGSEEIGTPLGAFDSAALWARANGCSDSARYERNEEFAAAPAAVDRFTFCAHGAKRVELLVLEGWGHEWPGRRRLAKKPADHPLADFDAASEIWRFFSQLPVPSPAVPDVHAAPSPGRR